MRDQVHDCFINYIGEAPTDHQITLVIDMLPKDIINLADLEGEWDTEVGDKVHVWFRTHEKVVFTNLAREAPLAVIRNFEDITVTDLSPEEENLIRLFRNMHGQHGVSYSPTSLRMTDGTATTDISSEDTFLIDVFAKLVHWSDDKLMDYYRKRYVESTNEHTHNFNEKMSSFLGQKEKDLLKQQRGK
jgi:hypothetical protein